MSVALILHLAIWRLRPSNDPRVVLLACLGGVGMIVSGIMDVLLEGVTPLGLWEVASFDAFVIVYYMIIYGALARSVSLTLLGRLLRAPGQRLDFDDLCQEYISSSRFEDRIDVMCRSGLATCEGKRITLSAKGRWIVGGAQFLSRFLADRMEG